MSAEMHLKYGLELWNKGAAAQAAQAFIQAIKLQPDCAEAYNNLGVIEFTFNRCTAAVACFRQAIELCPDYLDAYNNLGLVFKDTNQTEEAAKCFRYAISLNANYVNAYHNLGALLLNMNQPEAAQACFRRLIELQPDYPENYTNLGVVLTNINHFEEAEACLRRAIALAPMHPTPHMNLGVVFMNTGRPDEAAAAFHQALKVDGAYAEADYALGILHLQAGRFDIGWEKYESRLKCRANSDFKEVCYYLSQFRRWRGETLAGRTIVLFHEQGFGDTIQYLRYVPQVAELAAAAILWVKQPLEKLLTAGYENIAIHIGADPPTSQFDYFVPLPSLPFMFKTTEQLIPQNIPYLCQAWLFQRNGNKRSLPWPVIADIGLVLSGPAVALMVII